MRYIFTLLLFVLLGTGCKQKILSGKELEDKLKETMGDYLHKTLKPETQFDIRDLTYYADKEKKRYICQFKVNVHTPTSDTTGIMRVFITNDFTKVDRTD
jgi:hypothetical protein